MPYCQKCGVAIDENAKYCFSCGAYLDGEEGRMEQRKVRSGGTRIVLLVFGAIIILVSLGLFVGGGALLWVNTSLVDSEGFITTSAHQLEKDSYAITFQHIDINMGEVVGDWGVWRPSPSDFVTVKLTCSSNNPSKNVFIGIGEESDVEAYLFNVYYHEVTSFSVPRLESLVVEYTTHPGDSITSIPESQTFWTISAYGAGPQTLEWEPEVGSFWIVLINEDGSAGLDLSLTLGIKIPLLSTIGLVLLFLGGIALMFGGIMVYIGVKTSS